ncbi:alpha/beta fold hydrolase [Flavobacterium sp. RHBU_24]|uniref:alpha/beta fold hydrolase n=1 Tax=Flavobacterium sp. RHBU_24 TaxID=3391185 RepID=UPI003984D210
MADLHNIIIAEWKLLSGKSLHLVSLSYQTFGPPIGTAPVVLVNHALTGNSNVSGPAGWWNDLIGRAKTVDTRHYTVLAFNIPGNGYDGVKENLLYNYKDITAEDVAALFWKGLEKRGIHKLFALIGGSLGGGIAWHMAALRPDATEHLIPIATDWKATDWVIANTLVQERILNNSADPLADARLHAMLLYRTPQSLKQRFNREQLGGSFDIELWLDKHGKKLASRFTLPAYKLMNRLLRSINIAGNDSFLAVAKKISSTVHLVDVDTDLLFTPDETQVTYVSLKAAGITVTYNEIHSVHGHDAFLIEHGQLSKILKPVFEVSEGYYTKAYNEGATEHKV